MAQFDFTKTFDNIGKIFVQGIAERIRKQKGIDGASYSKVKPSTIKARLRSTEKTAYSNRKTLGFGKKSVTIKAHQREQASFNKSLAKKLGKAGTDNRLFVSGEFANEGFSYKAIPNGVKVFAEESQHEGGVTNAQILRWNSRGQPKLNRHIANPPLVFPTNKNEIMMMTNEWELARRAFQKDAKAQMKDMANMKMKVVLNIG